MKNESLEWHRKQLTELAREADAARVRAERAADTSAALHRAWRKYAAQVTDAENRKLKTFTRKP